MKLSGLIILAASIMAIGLTIGGGYIAVDNLINPQGYLFEGIVLTAIGLLTFLVLAVANSIGSMIILFKNVYMNQLDMQQHMIEYFKEIQGLNKPRSIADILGKIGPSSMTITDLNTGETTSTPLAGHEAIGRLNEMIANALNKNKGSKKELADMNREELEEELAKAVKKDDFERAADIKQIIRKLDKKDNPEDDNKEDKGE